MDYGFDYAEQNWDNIHKVPNLKIGELVQASTFSFNNIKGPRKLRYTYVGPCFIISLHGINAVQVELSGEFENELPTFSVSFINPYPPGDTELFPLRNPNPSAGPPVEQDEDKKIKKVIKEKKLRGKRQRE
ncbi:hypothetical protein O181_091246 [Austropuccinia psidii MF-1]|uniref:F5/8 type C domain-containing protein n=1 Tax=Austropuccinia psidii MF-1 TaxID=1389203 RepID=A0A9Q3IX20_9BASI|nr:hypothetical protein [Austropuccinia psidii MF-1]